MEQVKTHAKSLGWGFLLAWVFCMFYSGSMDSLSNYADVSSLSLALQLATSVLPVSFAIVTLAFVVALERKHGSPAQNRTLRIACPVVTAAGTLCMFAPVGNQLSAWLLFVAASAATGIGSGLMWVMWGQHYARLNQEAVETCAPVSAVLAAFLSLVAMLVPVALSDALVVAFPLVSGVAFSRVWASLPTGDISDQASKPAAPGPLSHAAKSMGRAGFGILAACLFVSCEGSFWQAGIGTDLQTSAIFIISAAFMLIVGSFATSGPRRVTLAYAYRWMCPFMAAGFAALIVVGGEAGAYFAAIVGIASRFVFCLITQMYFASLASRGAATPVQAYGMGWIFVHLGDFLGVVCTVVFEYLIQNGCMTLASIAALCSVAMVAAMMFALGGERFLSWELPGHMAGSSAFYAQADAADATASESGVADDAAADVAVEQAPAAKPPASQDASVAAAVAAVQATATAEVPVLAADPLAPRIEKLADQYKLTKREREVFALLAHGRSVPYIRDALIISKDTAATHTKHIYAKLGVHSRQELISMVEGKDQASA